MDHIVEQMLSQHRSGTLGEIKQILLSRFESIDYSQAKDDVLPFIQNPASLDMWSKDVIQSITHILTSESGTGRAGDKNGKTAGPGGRCTGSR